MLDLHYVYGAQVLGPNGTKVFGIYFLHRGAKFDSSRQTMIFEAIGAREAEVRMRCRLSVWLLRQIEARTTHLGFGHVGLGGDPAQSNPRRQAHWSAAIFISSDVFEDNDGEPELCLLEFSWPPPPRSFAQAPHLAYYQPFWRAKEGSDRLQKPRRTHADCLSYYRASAAYLTSRGCVWWISLA